MNYCLISIRTPLFPNLTMNWTFSTMPEPPAFRMGYRLSR